jgi:tRNA pseudouridine55 synthase
MNAISNIYEQGQVLLIDKPLGWSSFDVIKKIRPIVKTKKVGHAGTLDPLATGLLIVCTGKFTKRIQEYQAQAKEYTGTITLGATTPTFDLESEPAHIKDTTAITEMQIRQALQQFTGTIQQVPPVYSAIKKQGTRMYELARKGASVVLEPRTVTIHRFEVDTLQLPVIGFTIVCSTGTYIRSLANDLGAALGVGGYLSSLRRTAIGNYRVEEALSVQQLQEKINL